MSRPLHSLKGVELVDALLEEWPTSERATLDWDDFAEGIMAKLETEPLGPRAAEATSDAKFLLAPDLNGAITSGAEAPVSHPLVPAPSLLRATVGESDARAPHVEETMSASQRDRRSSLQDLAKMANEGPRSQRGGANGNGPDSFGAAPMSQRSSGRLSEGSGVVDLQSLSVLPVYGESPSEVVLPPSSKTMPGTVPGVQPKSDTFALGTASSTPGYVAVASENPPSMQESVPPMPQSIAPAFLSDSGITPPRRMSGPGVGVVFGGIVGVLAVAAGALFFVVSKKAPTTDTAAASVSFTAPADPVEAPVVAPTDQVEPVAQAAQNDEAAKPADGAMDPSALPVTAAKTDETAHRANSSSKESAPVAAAAGPSKKEAKEAAAKEAKEAKEAKKLAAATPPPPSGIPDNALGAEMKKAAGPGVLGSGVESNKTDPQFAAGTVPQRPSQGTLTSALGRVVGKAKSCIGPDDPISRASVVFASAGTVSSVSVSGHAAGKPAEACIKAALSGAKLNTPFAEPTYTTTVTIRP